MWNPQEYDGITDVRVDAKSVWRPDILLFNRCAFINIILRFSNLYIQF